MPKTLRVIHKTTQVLTTLLSQNICCCIQLQLLTIRDNRLEILSRRREMALQRYRDDYNNRGPYRIDSSLEINEPDDGEGYDEVD